MSNLYILWQQPRIINRWEGSTEVLPAEVLWGAVISLLILEATRRAVSPWLSGLVALFLAYLFVGPWLPGILHHKGFTFGRAVELMYLYNEQGIYGSLTGISATVIFIFVLFGCFIIRTGLGQFFTDLAAWLEGRLGEGHGRRAVVQEPFTADFCRYPVLAEVALTYRCNLTCGFCYAGCGSARLPAGWSDDRHGTFCLLCRRAHAADAALENAPSDTNRQGRAKLRAAALIEFEILRDPDRGNGEIARACRSSIPAVAKARRKLDIPEPSRN